MQTKKLSGIVFDLDNTLVSSTLNFEQIRQVIQCPSDIDLLDFVDTLAGQEKLEAEKLLIEYEVADAKNTSKFKGTDELLNLLNYANIPCAIITRNCRAAAKMKIESNAIDIPILLTREDYKAKPAPDALLHLCQYWQKPPEQLLYVGDYLYDIQTAINANTMSCLVTHGKKLPYAKLADYVVKDLNQLNRLVSTAFNLQILDEASL
jgi:HAD superfamily hydrolase (TIGR01549 family)